MAATGAPTGSFYNATVSLLPSPADLALALPRLAQRAGSLVLGLLEVDSILSLVQDSGSVIADATPAETSKLNRTISAAVDALNASITSPPGSIPTWTQAASAKAGFMATLTEGMSWQRISNFDSIFSYLASRWAIATFVIAIVLNRAHVYASARRHLRLNWQSRLVIRILPIILFMYQVVAILETMRCQTGTFLAESGVTDKQGLLNGAFMGEGGLLFSLSSWLLFWQTEEQSCVNAKMTPSGDMTTVVGSSSVLWPLFISLCISHFLETISCALQGQRPQAETGMTIFEHSLAFAEAEAVMRSSVGLGIFDISGQSTTVTSTVTKTVTSTLSAMTSMESSAPKSLIPRGMLLRRSNVPPEILLVALISSMSHLTSHALAVAGLQSRWRLVNTTTWGLCFMWAFGWSFFRFSYAAAQTGDAAALRYPTVVIVGFIPHLLIIIGSIGCAIIYGFALLITVLSPPSEEHAQGSLWQRIKMAHDNLQANASLSTIHLSWEDEFYTTLLKVGFTVLTAASEAVYFNEGASVTVAKRTWLEEKRLGEIERRKNTSLRLAIPPEIQGDSLGAGGLNMVEEEIPLDDGTVVRSGYGRERKTMVAGSAAGAAALQDEGAGGSQRGGRLYLAWQHTRQVWRLNVCIAAKMFTASLHQIGFRRIPAWLRRRATISTPPLSTQGLSAPAEHKPSHMFWMLAGDGNKMEIPHDLNVDVEYETRKRLLRGEGPADGSEQAVDSHLYRWWRMNGWWGDIDSSGDYKPAGDVDDDTTSVVSTAAGEEDNDTSPWESDADDEREDGRRTPTQGDYTMMRRRRERSTTPAYDEDGDEEEDSMHRLSRLLDPKSLEERQEARMLARHLATHTPMTRSQYRAQVNRDKLHLLIPGGSRNARMSAEEEEDLLEQIIVSQRRNAAAADNKTWAEGGTGMGESGPVCVVCHSSPRTIICWPCRDVAICEGCRVSLAMNNFGTCVCCRRDVVAFSRLWVP